MSVAEMVDQSHKIVFASTGSYAENKGTGETVYFERRNNVFELTLDVPPYEQVKETMQRAESITALEKNEKKGSSHGVALQLSREGSEGSASHFAGQVTKP
jgi:hypothetical protein